MQRLFEGLPIVRFFPESGQRKESKMNTEDGLKELLMGLVGEEGCGIACDDADIYQDDDGWKLRLCGFLEPWKLGTSESAARASLVELARMGFGLSR
jgi:hypothetical protein